MIEVKGLRKSFCGREVLRGIDLSVSAGTVVGVAGPNACGKSTFMKCLLGLVVPDSGEIRIAGRLISQGGEFRRSIGYMPQNPQFPGNLKAYEILEMLEDLRREKAAARDELVNYFDLLGLLRQPVGEFSGGTKQRLAAVVALMFASPVVLLDEPTAGMDPLVSIRFKRRVSQEAEAGRCFLFVSHLLTEIEQLASEIMFLSEGEVVFSGTTARLLAQTGATAIEPALAQVFKERQA